MVGSALKWENRKYAQEHHQAKVITQCEQEAQCIISAKKRNLNNLDIISLYVPFTFTIVLE